MARTAFGFESRIGQASYPILISIMLLMHRYVFPAYPTLKTAEFFLSITLIAVYVACRKFLTRSPGDRGRLWVRSIQKVVEVYIGITVLSSLIYMVIKKIAE